MKQPSHTTLRRLAVKYIWWKSPELAMHSPERIAAQVMNLGDYADVQDLIDAASPRFLRNVLRLAEAGQFNERSWHYWHYRLGLAGLGEVPPMPVRQIE